MTIGLDNLGMFKLPPEGWFSVHGPKWLTVKTVREVFCDTYTTVFFLVVEFTPKKGDKVGPLFEGPNPVRRVSGPVWHVIRWSYAEFKAWADNDYVRWKTRPLCVEELLDLAIQIAQNDGLGAVQGTKPIGGVGPWPKRAQALAALCDVATRERAAYEEAVNARISAADAAELA